MEGIQVNLPLSSEVTLAFGLHVMREEVRSKVVTMEKSLGASRGTILIVDPILRRRIEKTRAAAIAPLARLCPMLADLSGRRPALPFLVKRNEHAAKFRQVLNGLGSTIFIR